MIVYMISLEEGASRKSLILDNRVQSLHIFYVKIYFLKKIGRFGGFWFNNIASYNLLELISTQYDLSDVVKASPKINFYY